MSGYPSSASNRTCRYCRAKFKPVREDQRFCSPNHRKAFWKYGGLPFDKMRDQIMKEVNRVLKKQYDELLKQLQLNKGV